MNSVESGKMKWSANGGEVESGQFGQEDLMADCVEGFVQVEELCSKNTSDLFLRKGSWLYFSGVVGRKAELHGMKIKLTSKNGDKLLEDISLWALDFGSETGWIHRGLTISSFDDGFVLLKPKFVLKIQYLLKAEAICAGSWIRLSFIFRSLS